MNKKFYIKSSLVIGVLFLISIVGVTTAFGYDDGLIDDYYMPRITPYSEVDSMIYPTITPTGQVLGKDTYNFTQTLKYKMTGEGVEALQGFLNNSGFDCGLVDGVFGNKTKIAVIKFQLANNLDGDGIVGAKTRLELNR